MKKYQKWQIYQANLEPVIGSEQGKSRPILIISENSINDVLNCVNILPLTSRKVGRIIYPNEALLPSNSFGLPNESIVLCHQVRTLDKKRLSTEYGMINDKKIQKAILEALAFQFGIDIN